jgi:hypothetical protein
MVSGGPMVPLAWPARRDSDVMGYVGDPTVDDIGFVAEFDRRTTIKIFVRTVLKPLVELLPVSQVVCLREESKCLLCLFSFDSIPMPARGAHEPCQSNSVV